MKSLKTFIEAWLIYNVVLVSDVQQSESVVHIHILTLFYILFPIYNGVGHYKEFSRVP